MAGIFKLAHGRPLSALAISGTPATTATVGVAYSFVPTIRGGRPPYTCSCPTTFSGGFSFNTMTGAVTAASPTAAQTISSIVITATDSVGQTISLASFSIAVSDATTGYGNDGTGVKPGGAIDVANVTALYAALATAAPGNVYYLAIGTYGDLEFNGTYADPGITIMGQTGVSCTSLYANGSTGLTVQYLDVLGLDAAGQYAAHIANASKTSFLHLTINPNLGGGVGVFIRDSNLSTVSHNLVQNIGDGIDTYGSTAYTNTHTTIEYNKIDGFMENAQLHVKTQYLTIRYNYTTRNTGTDLAGHPDHIQLATVDQVEVAYNNFDPITFGVKNDQGGVFMESVTNFNVHHNCLFSTSDNSISMGNACSFGTVNDNFSQGTVYSGRVILRDVSHDIVFDRNQVSTTPPIVDYAGGGANYNITLGSGADANVTIAQATSMSDTTLRNAFLAANPTIPAS